MILKCKVCGKEFKTFPAWIRKGGGKFCSRDCHYKWNVKKIKRVCKICGKEFKICPCVIKDNGGKFCSWNCYKKWVKVKENNANWKGGKVKVVCKTCGKIFEVSPYFVRNGYGKFCSLSCRSLWSVKHSKKQNTSIEIKTENLLKELKISYQAQKIIKEGRTVADFYIPAQRIVIYTDGQFWHNSQWAREHSKDLKDNTTDLLLGLNGYKVLRLSEKEINKEPRICLKKIKNIIKV